MNINNLLNDKFDKLSINNIGNENEFLTYDNFKNFILKHYNLTHIEKYNYIKFVKIKRQILKLKENEKYTLILDEINRTIKIMNNNHVFPCIDIKNYMFKLATFLKIIDNKKKSINNAINTIRNIFNIKNINDKIFQIKIITAINNLNFKYQIFLKFSKKLIYLINQLINLEFNFGIDHKLIDLNNLERAFLGKKSEYIVNKVITEHLNNFQNYYYITNIDFIKLLNIEINHPNNLKGEVDGLILFFNGKNYIIEKIIEVKSSIKSTFEDTQKFVFLQNYINNLDDNFYIKFNNFFFTKESFKNIIHKDVHLWTTYICINTFCYDTLEKSYLYFSNVLKIIDNDFIEDFYINNNDNVILEKYKIIENNRNYIDDLFKNWIENIKFGTEECNIYVSKRNN
jgi:hypothetical protein